MINKELRNKELNMYAYLNTSVITKIAELKPKELKVYQYLITNCNKSKDFKYTDKRGHLHALQPGQIVTTGRSISSVVGSKHHETGMDILKSLERRKMIQLYITKRVTGFRSKGFTIVTVTDIKDAPYNPLRANEVMRENIPQNTPYLHALNNSIKQQKEAEPKVSAIPPIDKKDSSIYVDKDLDVSLNLEPSHSVSGSSMDCGLTNPITAENGIDREESSPLFRINSCGDKVYPIDGVYLADIDKSNYTMYLTHNNKTIRDKAMSIKSHVSIDGSDNHIIPIIPESKPITRQSFKSVTMSNYIDIIHSFSGLIDLTDTEKQQLNEANNMNKILKAGK